MFKILIAEDDRELRQLFAHVLTKNGYTVLGVSNGEEALAALEQSYYDLIISDIMMPKMDGYELVRSIRESGSSIPIMMITAKDAFDDMRLGFLSGSDDYMVKPINIGEMVLRVSALLRRAQMASERRQVIGGTVMECDSLSVTVDGESMVLPQKEFMLLYKMASFPGRIFTRQQLMDDIWGYDSSTDTHTVDVHIARLRERFRDNPDFKIVTMRGVGYKVVHMKKRRNKFFDIRVQFFFICMAGFIGVALLAALAAWGLEHLGVNVPMFVWLLIFTLLLGSATAAGFSIAFFAPISRLSRAMKEVAGGNFRVHVETKSVFRDIRDSFDSFNLMVSELNATETLQTDFISNVSHEFKTPISAIEGYASLLQEHQQSPEEQAEYIDKILFNTRRLSALAGNILLLSKLDSQSIHPQRSRFRLDEQVRQCILALERKWTEKDVDFDVDLDSVDFTGYEGLLQHVWTNLIDNAVKFGPRGGLIRMRLIEEDGSVLFTIDNEGKSISDEDKSRIFNKFYQGDSSHESEGNGLGLALVRKIVAIHGGEVWVEDPVNGGCRFAVRLPTEK